MRAEEFDQLFDEANGILASADLSPFGGDEQCIERFRRQLDSSCNEGADSLLELLEDRASRFATITLLMRLFLRAKDPHGDARLARLAVEGIRLVTENESHKGSNDEGSEG